MRTVGLIVAGGSGTRAGGGVPKQYRALGGRAVIAWAYAALRTHPAIEAVYLVIAEGDRRLLETALPGITPDFVATGGSSRRASVVAGLRAIGTADRVLIHDAARPLLSHDVIDRLLDSLDETAGVVPVLPVADSLVRDGNPVGRDDLYRVQTPQAFRFADIVRAHEVWNEEAEATDDAAVLRADGGHVTQIAGDRRLEKITTDADFAAAERWLPRRIAVGNGYDVHRLEDGEELWLGGVLIPHDRGLSGHSDADVGLHALTDAILGALGDGDIGSHFPPSDPRWRGARSGRFLQHARALVQAAGGRIDHVDLTLICETPRIGPHRAAMRAEIARLLELPLTRVSIKATTTERLGFTGRGEGIAAQATATLSLVAEWPEAA